VVAFVDHRLDSENVADLHEAYSFVVPVMGYVGSAVENLADSMASVRADNCVAFRFDNV